MSRFRYLSTTDENGVSVVDTNPVLCFPMRSVEQPLVPGSFALTLEEMCEWWWRFRHLRLDFSFTVNTGTLEGEILLERQRVPGSLDINDEPYLMLPGADAIQTDDAAYNYPPFICNVFEGGFTSYGWNGDPDAELSPSASLRICYVGASDGLPPGTGWALDNNPNRLSFNSENGLWTPTLALELDVFFTTPGSELNIGALSYAFNTDPDLGRGFLPDGGFSFSANVLSDYGGGLKGMGCYDYQRTAENPGNNISAASITVTPVKWFPYLKDGGFPIWDEDTGARLRSPSQSPA